MKQSACCLPVIIIAACCLSGCGRSGSESQADSNLSVAPRAELRLVTLSPHLAELVYAVGAGDMLVGVSAYTDYPPAVTDLPTVGDAFALDQERLTILQPDLLLAWQSGTPLHVVDELRARGYRVEVIKTVGVADVGRALREIGALTGYEENGDKVASAFEYDLRELANEYRDADSISVFYQVARRPLYTINDSHYISDLIEICGGRNVFAELDNLAPMISVEAVLERDPEVLLASEDAGVEAFSDWDRWSNLAANLYANRFMMPAAEIGRATPRLRMAAIAMCDALDRGRFNREPGHE